MLSDYQTLVDDLLRDRDQIVTSDQRDAAITAALSQYCVDAPRPVVADVQSAGGALLAFPAGWTDDSQLLSVEYPIGLSPVSELPLSEISTYSTPTTKQLLLPVELQNGESVRVTYTGAHLLDDANDTVPIKHRLALACLAASILCGQLASYYVSEGEATISADTVNRQTKSDTWRARARDLAAVYADKVGAAPNPRTKAASVTVNPQPTNALGGRRLFHPPRNWPVN